MKSIRLLRQRSAMARMSLERGFNKHFLKSSRVLLFKYKPSQSVMLHAQVDNQALTQQTALSAEAIRLPLLRGPRPHPKAKYTTSEQTTFSLYSAVLSLACRSIY